MNETIVTNPISRLLAVFREVHATEAAKVPQDTIHVSDIVSKVAFLYEKVRNIVGYEEEHLLRKNAIKRILIRRLLAKREPEDVAKSLIHELIWARYLANDTVPKSVVGDVANVIRKYRVLFQNLRAPQHSAEKRRRRKFIFGLAACEMEETLVPDPKREALVKAMYEVTTASVELADPSITLEERELQKYNAIASALTKSDFDLIYYRLFRLYAEPWFTHEERAVLQIAEEFTTYWRQVEEKAKYPLRERLLRMMKKQAVPYQMLRDVMEQHTNEVEAIFADPVRLRRLVREATAQRYRQIGAKLRRSIVRSIIYIFITKMTIALLFEVPFDFFWEGQLNTTALLINTTTPVVLMILIAVLIRMPSEKNTEKIIRNTEHIAYGTEIGEAQKTVKPPRQYSSVLYAVFYVLYAALFCVSFGFFVWGLRALEFNMLSGLIFILFLCLVSFLGFKIRLSSKELVILRRKDSTITFIIDLLALPIVRAGRWLSLNFSKVNIFVFVFDFIFEAPFKVVIEVVEDWLGFLREKKDEITEN